jgi:hypothetical protein
MAKANLQELGRELTVNFDHDHEAGERRCSYWEDCQGKGVKYTVAVTGIQEGMVDVAREDRVYSRAERRVKRAAHHGKVLCPEHFEKLVSGQLHTDTGVKLEFGAGA